MRWEHVTVLALAVYGGLVLQRQAWQWLDGRYQARAGRSTAMSEPEFEAAVREALTFAASRPPRPLAAVISIKPEEQD